MRRMGNDWKKNTRMTSTYPGEAQRKAQEMVKDLLAQIKEEPLPNERSLKHEDQEMKELERRLARLLTPMDKLETTRGTHQKSKNSQKKTKKK